MTHSIKINLQADVVAYEDLLKAVRNHFPTYDLAQFLIQVNCDSIEDVCNSGDQKELVHQFKFDEHIKGTDYWWDFVLRNLNRTECLATLQNMVDTYYAIIKHYNARTPIRFNEMPNN